MSLLTSELLKSVIENLTFVLEFLVIIIGLFAVALALEKLAQKKRGVKEPVFTVRKMAMIGMFSAIAMILHLGRQSGIFKEMRIFMMN